MTKSLLYPGLAIFYFGKRRLFRRPVAYAHIIGRETETDVFHVATFRPRPGNPAELEVDVAFLPLTRRALEKSIARVLKEVQIEAYYGSLVSKWREAKNTKGAGVFIKSIWEAEKAAWETASLGPGEIGPDRYFIEIAYPLEGPDGLYRLVHAECLPRSPGG